MDEGCLGSPEWRISFRLDVWMWKYYIVCVWIFILYRHIAMPIARQYVFYLTTCVILENVKKLSIDDSCHQNNFPSGHFHFHIYASIVLFHITRRAGRPFLFVALGFAILSIPTVVLTSIGAFHSSLQICCGAIFGVLSSRVFIHFHKKAVIWEILSVIIVAVYLMGWAKGGWWGEMKTLVLSTGVIMFTRE